MTWDRRMFISGLGISLTLPGCATLRNRQSIDGPSFAGLMQHLKHDIGTYVFERESELRAQPRPSPSVCGDQVSFTIERVKMTVTANRAQNRSLSAGLRIPVNLVTLGGNFSRSRILENSVSVTVVLYPFAPETPEQRVTAIPPPSEEFDGTPIRDTLTGLLEAMRRTANTPPCFRFGQGDQQKDNVLKWAFTVREKAGGGLKFEVLLFSIGGEVSEERSYANVVEASFKGVGGAFIA